MRHHLVDVADPDEPYDAARYSEAGRAVIARLHQAGVPPLVAGGTGLYIKALLAGLFQQDQGGPRRYGRASPGSSRPRASQPCWPGSSPWTRLPQRV